MARFETILDTIGHTPLVKLQKLAPAGVNVYVKVEAFNPMGSVKDRLALGIIEAAERDGALKPGQTVIEATSGNTGIGLAMVCAQKGYPLVVVMAENFSVERRRLMRFLGAKVVLTPAAEKGTGMLAKATGTGRRRTAGSCAGSSTTKPTRTCIRAPPRRRSWTPSTAGGWTTGSPASAPAARSRAWRGCSRRRVRRYPHRGQRAGQLAVLASGIVPQLTQAGRHAAASHPLFVRT